MPDNTELTLARLEAAVGQFQQDYAQGKQSAREANHSVLAKLDNLDRTVSELRLTVETGEKARQAELKRIFDLLAEERTDRRDLVNTQGRDEKALIQELVRSELKDRHQAKNMWVGAAQAVWTAGGKYIVLAFALLFAAAVMKMTGLKLTDFISLPSIQVQGK